MAERQQSGLSVEDYYAQPTGSRGGSPDSQGGRGTRTSQQNVQISPSPYDELSGQSGPKDYWTSPGTPTEGRLVTDSSTRNHFREKNARENWRESMMSKTDLDRLERGTEWTSGYTGHVPRLRDTFAMRNVVAAQFLKPDPSVLDDLLPNMHDQSRPMTTGSSRLTTAGSSRSGVGVAGPRVEGVCGGQRRLVVSPTQKYPGNGFCGTVLPSRRTDRISRLQVYEQGTKVNLSSYYATSEARNWQVSWIQSGFAGKNKSTIQNGDLYYFSGKHMYETTNGETYGRPENTKAKVEKLSVEEEDLRVKNRLHTYAVAKAVVGKTRIDKITQEIKRGLEARVAGTVGFRRRMFTIFDKSGTGTVDPIDFQHVCHDLGVPISETEAIAVYGSHDVNGDGAMSFQEFLAGYMGEIAIGMEKAPESLSRNGSDDLGSSH